MKDNNQEKPTRSKAETTRLVHKNIDRIIDQIHDFTTRKDVTRYDGMKFQCHGVTVDLNIDYSKLK